MIYSSIPKVFNISLRTYIGDKYLSVLLTFFRIVSNFLSISAIEGIEIFSSFLRFRIFAISETSTSKKSKYKIFRSSLTFLDCWQTYFKIASIFLKKGSINKFFSSFFI